MEAMMPSADFLSTPELNYEQWRDLLRPNWGLYTPDDPKAFAGRVRSRSICGFNASDISNNIRRCERTQRDARLDGVDHCYAVFQIAGRSTLIQNDHAVTLAVGDVALIDSARAVTYVNDGHEQWLSLQLPRQLLTSHLGFEPQGGFRGRPGTRAGRLLFQLVLDAADDEEPMSTSAGNYMQLAVYDLLGALFAPLNPAPVSLYTDRLFKRMSSRIALLIQISVRARWLPRSGFRCATSKNCSRSAVLPAATSFIHCAWITLRVLSGAGHR
jgi:AraC family transcriptional regulator, positive regulator of tynA and feaB